MTTVGPLVTTTITPRGRFDLAQSIDFGFGPRAAAPGTDVMRLAFVVDGTGSQVGVAVRQDAGGTVRLEIQGEADPDVVTAQVARMLSLDVDATGWDALGARDELIGRLQAARPGLRPPLFHSAYEAAAWSVLSARRPRQQMAALRDRLAAAHGATFAVADQDLSAFPTPEQLLAVTSFDGLPSVKLDRLHAVARLALDGGLDTATLRALDPAQASERVRQLDGIGPFYATLIVVRALGHTDVLPTDENLVTAVLGELLGRREAVSQAEFAAMAADWTPWRTWAGVAIRSAGPRLLPTTSVVARRSVSR